MAKLVFGNTKQNAVIAVVKEKQPVIDTLNVTPTTSAQTITAPSGTDGYSPVNVSAVDSSIDANIVAGNIKSGVSILGVNGSVVELNGTTTSVTPTTSAQTITPTAPNNGFTEVSVSAVTSAIDANIQAGNIKQGVTILGVAGNYSGITPTGTLSITTNGTYDVTNYASADVQVPSSAPAYYVEKTVDANGVLGSSAAPMMNWVGIKRIDTANTLELAYTRCAGLSGNVIIGDDTEARGLGCLKSFISYCSNITSLVLKINKLSGSNCCQSMCEACTSLTTVDWDSLTEISASNTLYTTFTGCFNLQQVKFNGLAVMSYPICPSYGKIFTNCNKLESVEFGGLTASTFSSSVNQLQDLFVNTTGSQATNGCTIHFPSNFDPSDPDHTFDASTLSGYPTFGGSASYIHVAFDLPATE